MVQAAASLTSSLLAVKRRAASGSFAPASPIPPAVPTPPGALLPLCGARPAALPEPPRGRGARTHDHQPAQRVKFSLRLDPERHQRLKRAAARQGQSGQRLLTEALDRHLEQLSSEAAAGTGGGRLAAVARNGLVQWPRKP